MNTKTCSVEGCGNKHSAKGYCYTHYRRMRRRGEFGTCEVSGCENGKDRGAMCNPHYMRKLRGAPLDAPIKEHFKDGLRESYEQGDAQSVAAKVKARCHINNETGCWEYPNLTTRGYGEVSMGEGPAQLAHRLIAWATLPDYRGYLQVHHACAHRACCNPAHLRVVTPQENTAEMMERNYYINRIKQLEEAIRKVDANHPILAGQ